MNTTLAVVVSAIVILITALVVITIFSNAIQSFSTIAQAKTNCQAVYITSCQTFGQTPYDWSTPKFRVGDLATLQSCADVASCSCTPGTGSTPNVAACT
jgi:hypothetical protein